MNSPLKLGQNAQWRKMEKRLLFLAPWETQSQETNRYKDNALGTSTYRDTVCEGQGPTGTLCVGDKCLQGHCARGTRTYRDVSGADVLLVHLNLRHNVVWDVGHVGKLLPNAPGSIKRTIHVLLKEYW